MRQPKTVTTIKLTTMKDLQELNLSPIKAEIGKQYGTIYAYCKEFELDRPRVTKFLGKKVAITFKEVMIHCENLKLEMSITISRTKEKT